MRRMKSGEDIGYARTIKISSELVAKLENNALWDIGGEAYLVSKKGYHTVRLGVVREEKDMFPRKLRVFTNDDASAEEKESDGGE